MSRVTYPILDVSPLWNVALGLAHLMMFFICRSKRTRRFPNASSGSGLKWSERTVYNQWLARATEVSRFEVHRGVCIRLYPAAGMRVFPLLLAGLCHATVLAKAAQSQEAVSFRDLALTLLGWVSSICPQAMV